MATSTQEEAEGDQLVDLSEWTAENSSGYRGVHKTASGRFQAAILHEQKAGKKRRNVHIGSFDTAEEAATAYARAHMRLHSSAAKGKMSFVEAWGNSSKGA